MKQHITPDDLAQLTEEQKEKLRLYWSKENRVIGDLYFHETDENKEIRVNTKTVFNPFNDYLPLLSIGQMIDILHNNVNVSFFDRKPGPVWSVMKDNVWFDDKELVDSLWSAVKSIL